MLSKLQNSFPIFSSKNSSQLHFNCFKVTAWFSATCSACYCSVLVSCLAYLSTLKIEATYSSVTSIDFKRTTRLYVSEAITLHNHRCENLGSYACVKVIFFQYEPKLYSFRNFNDSEYRTRGQTWRSVHFLQRMCNKEQQRRHPYMSDHWLS
jgi:hypothetical protein